MARLFNLKVLEANVPGGATARNIYTEADLATTLGSADTWDVQINIDAISTANTTLTFTYDNSNDGQNWQTGAWTQTVNIATLADAPKTSFYHVELTAAFAKLALGRFGVKADQPGAFVRLIVCGRSQ